MRIKELFQAPNFGVYYMRALFFRSYILLYIRYIRTTIKPRRGLALIRVMSLNGS